MSPPSPPDELDVAPLDELDDVPPEEELDEAPLDELDASVSEQHPSTALDPSELPESPSRERLDEVPHARTAKKEDVASVVLANAATFAFVFMIKSLSCAEIVQGARAAPDATWREARV